MELIALIKLGLAAYYLTAILLFDMQDVGPFPSGAARVRHTVDGALAHKPVDAFDRLRFLFGAYRITTSIEGHPIWFVRPHFMLVWICPACLGFWVAVALTFFSFFVPQGQPLVDIFAVAGIVLFLSMRVQ